MPALFTLPDASGPSFPAHLHAHTTFIAITDCHPDPNPIMSALLFFSSFLLLGVCLRASGSLRDLLAASQISNRDSESPLASLRPLRPTLFSTPSTGSTGSIGSTPSTSPDASVSVRACPCPSVPPPPAASQLPNPESEIPNPLVLLPEPLADALETLTDELRHRLAFYRYLDPASGSTARRARRDARFAVRLRAIYTTIARVHDADPSARPVDPAEFLPSPTAAELARSEKFLGELTHAWRIYEAHPTAAELDRALTALARITRLRRSLFDLARLGPPPDAFPGWDADNDLNPFDEAFEPRFPDGVDRPPAFPLDSEPLTPTQLLDRLLGSPGAAPSLGPEFARHSLGEGGSACSALSPNSIPFSESPASHPSHRSHPFHVSSHSSYPTHPSHGFHPNPSASSLRASASLRETPSASSPRRPRSLACIPGWLLRLIRRYGPALLYLRPRYLNPVIRRMAFLAGMIVLHFPPPDAPPEKMSGAEAAWWRAYEKRRIGAVFRPEVEGELPGILPSSLPPWGFDDPPWEA